MSPDRPATTMHHLWPVWTQRQATSIHHQPPALSSLVSGTPPATSAFLPGQWSPTTADQGGTAADHCPWRSGAHMQTSFHRHCIVTGTTGPYLLRPQLCTTQKPGEGQPTAAQAAMSATPPRQQPRGPQRSSPQVCSEAPCSAAVQNDKVGRQEHPFPQSLPGIRCSRHAMHPRSAPQHPGLGVRKSRSTLP